MSYSIYSLFSLGMLIRHSYNSHF